jgi:hypothetical protein
MGLDLWFREDVMRILASAYETMQASTGSVTPLSPDVAEVYRQGFVDALRALAVAFGVTAPACRTFERGLLRGEGDSLWPGVPR